MACAQRVSIVYPSIIFRKSLFYNEKVDLIRPYLPLISPQQKRAHQRWALWGSEPRLSREAICRSFAP
jgi:hypothetical protein